MYAQNYDPLGNVQVLGASGTARQNGPEDADLKGAKWEALTRSSVDRSLTAMADYYGPRPVFRPVSNCMRWRPA